VQAQLREANLLRDPQQTSLILSSSKSLLLRIKRTKSVQRETKILSGFNKRLNLEKSRKQPVTRQV